MPFKGKAQTGVMGLDILAVLLIKPDLPQQYLKLSHNNNSAVAAVLPQQCFSYRTKVPVSLWHEVVKLEGKE